MMPAKAVDYEFECMFTPNSDVTPYVIETTHLYAMIFIIGEGPAWRSEVYSKFNDTCVYYQEFPGFDIADIATSRMMQKHEAML